MVISILIYNHKNYDFDFVQVKNQNHNIKGTHCNITNNVSQNKKYALYFTV